ncbi:MAG: hypothetical protein NC908_03130 [Candidatus Omnitrophica bacterium]|nr:hypothetical protein [Candidatus Omnitrophota bacterium]
MYIIITYASVGAGHFKAANAVFSYLNQHCKNVKVILIDILDKSNILFRLSYIYGYIFLVRHAILIWGLGFWLTYLRLLRPFTRLVISIINRLNTKEFTNFLIKENPDFVISTHFLPSEIAARLKTNRQISSKVISVVTDFCVHPFWISSGTYMYVVASGYTKEKLIKEGIKEEYIRDVGIPVESKFLEYYDRDLLLSKFGLSRNKFTVLIVTGSFGIGPIERIVYSLYKEVQLLVVCANNLRLYKKLKSKNYPGVKVFGFVDNIQELMAASDIIITKPGGISIAESLTMNLWPIFISPILGQESENIKALTYYGLGTYLKDVSYIREVILDFKNNPDKQKKAKERINSLRRPFAAREICDVVCQGSSGVTY